MIVHGNITSCFNLITILLNVSIAEISFQYLIEFLQVNFYTTSAVTNVIVDCK